MKTLIYQIGQTIKIEKEAVVIIGNESNSIVKKIITGVVNSKTREGQEYTSEITLKGMKNEFRVISNNSLYTVTARGSMIHYKIHN